MDSVAVVFDPEVEVVVAVPLEEPEAPAAVPDALEPEPVAVAEEPEALAPVAAEPVAVVAVASLVAPVILVTEAHWLLKELRRLDCSAEMTDCTDCASDCSSAPVAVTVAWNEANWLLIETTWLA